MLPGYAYALVFYVSFFLAAIYLLSRTSKYSMSSNEVRLPSEDAPSSSPPGDSQPSSETDGYDAIQIYYLQRDPEWMAMVRANFQKQEGPAPTTCSWCRRGADSEDSRMFRCRSCFSGLPACLRCIRVAHVNSPLHTPQVYLTCLYLPKTY
jgi:hypothetical protein